MFGVTELPIGSDCALQKRGHEHRLATSVAGGGGGDSCNTDTELLFNSHPHSKTLMRGVNRTEHHETKHGDKVGEEEGRRLDTAGIEAAGASSSRSFRVRLTHHYSPKTYAQSLNPSGSASLSPYETVAPWLGAAERRDRSNTQWEPSVEHQSRDCQQNSHQEREFHSAMEVTDHKTTGRFESHATPTTTRTRGSQLVRSFVSLEERPTQRAQEQRLAHEGEAQLRREYEAKIAELEGVIHAKQRAVFDAEAALVQKDIEHQTARASMAQRLNEEAAANARCMLEMTLEKREKEIEDTQEMLRAEQACLAGALQREEVLRSRFLVAEETRVLYQLYLQRLLELFRTRPKEGFDVSLCTGPLVTNRDVLKAIGEALRSTDAATYGETNATYELTPEGRGSGDVELQSSPKLSQQLTNATLLKMSMLESAVSDCMTLWTREERRRHEYCKQTIEAVVNSCREEMEAQLTLVLSVVGKTERRIDKYGKMVSTALGEIMKSGHDNQNCVDDLQREVKRLNREYAQSQRLLQRAQAEVSGLKDEVRRMDGDREVALLIHRAAECLEDVRQSVRGAVRSAAQDIERGTLECNTLKEPFLQSMRVIALKVEAHAEIARTAVRREQREGGGDPIETVMRRPYSVDAGDARHFILGTPRCNLRGLDWHAAQLPREDVAGESKNLLILAELNRVMKNFCQLLENNARQMDKNMANLAQTIASWEDSIVGKMNEIWGFMREMLAAGGMTSRPRPALAVHEGVQRHEWCNEPQLALGGTNTDGSTRVLIHQTPPLFSSAAGGLKSSCAGSVATSGSCAPSAVFASSTTGSVDASRAANAALTSSLRRAPLAPLHEVELTPDVPTRRVMEQTSPPSIAVSRTPTPPPPPPPPPSSQVINTAPPSQRPMQHQQQNYLHQQRRLFAEPPYNSPLPVNDSIPTLRMHYTRELGGVEGNELRLVSGAVLSRRAAASS
ncbi:hypothetical protein TraAM80_01091 [Trypanosoma rangeli]|uniref:Uncharacterized protein n=1 Tax=Trypanosoma rangeli TaxID=5698 RepID=A0A3R7P1C6_TRYRA|nr:uncharacterized protein TraAM80_01091 [Trypanosoma rangeli]RNF11124.1 hypothetical protein TraAM80_01091 [Trypanosoma rangeli]|eukprot:RNF11124.1 hypothetical protein TraAM80_01091 [Trypanosoma rangeli]